MRLNFTRTCLPILALVSANALADRPTDPAPGNPPPRTFKFENDPVAFSLNGVANAGILNSRCAENQLANNEQALARINWADRCGYLSKEKWWPLFEFAIHPLTGAKTKRAILAYPIFTQGPQHTLWIPTSEACDMPADAQYFTFCEAGCYTGDQELAFASGNESVRVPIAEASERWQQDVATARQSQQTRLPSDSLRILGLKEGSAFDSLAFKPLDVRRFLVSAKDEANAILEFRTAGGGTLKVTPDHPLVSAEGQALKASFFKEGDALVRQDGNLDPIVSIAHKVEFGKVYNVEPESSKSIEHIHIAQGFLAGSLALQNGDVSDFQRIMSRNTANAAHLALD